MSDLTDADEDQLYRDPASYAMRCDCPTCGARSGLPCVTSDGFRRFAPHSMRFRGDPASPIPEPQP
jgi:anaerobic selenocysteine-containing dehydrogenase